MKIKGVFDSLELSLCNFCPLSCEGCPSLPLGHARSRELDVSRLIPLLSPLFINRIVLCGNDGEPLEHLAIKSVLRGLCESFPEAQVQVSTNGQKIHELFSVKELGALPENLLFEVAVDGSRQQTHELTRKGGSLKEVLASIRLLREADVATRVVATRHSKNEDDLFALADMVAAEFGLETAFRDTSIVTSRLKPPATLSQNASVSELYGPPSGQGRGYTPNEKHLFINSNGDCYPCVSFVKYKTEHRPINIFGFSKTSEFLEEFRPFGRKFCECYQKEGDIRQCRINCGVFVDNYRYDGREDLKKLYD